MHTQSRTLLAVLFGLWLGAEALGQDSTAVERPVWRVGDSWTYNYIDNWKKEVVDVSVDKITEISAKEIKVEWVSKKFKNGTNLFNQDFNATIRNSGSSIEIRSSPEWPRYSFPMKPGKVWQQQVTWTKSNEPDWKVVADLKGTAQGWEKITVPAGTFDSLRIELQGRYTGSNSQRNWSGSQKEVYWFAPAVKRIVKYEFDDGTRKDGYELLDFKIAE
jgi:hypothetical protein